MNAELALKILEQANIEEEVGCCEKCPRKDKNKTCIGCLNEAKENILNQLQLKENETKNAKNKAEHYKDVLRQIIHYCNYLRNDHKYSLNDGHIRKIKKICEREVGADDKI